MGAAVHYYQKLARLHQERGSTLDLVMAHAETSRIFAYIEAHDPEGMAAYLCGYLHRLKSAGAVIGVVPAVTPLYCIRELTATSPLPLVSMADAVSAELSTQAARRVAIFGTRFVIESGFYGLLRNVEVICPRPAEVTTIHSIYTELLRDRVGSEAQHQCLKALAHTLISRDKVDSILIAGTDLALIFNQSNTRFPHVDCAAVHLNAVADALLNQPPHA